MLISAEQIFRVLETPASLDLERLIACGHNTCLPAPKPDLNVAVSGTFQTSDQSKEID